MTMNTATTVPWYRHRWPWLLIAPPAFAVVGGIATVALAVHSDDGVVAADYYKQGLAINQQLARRDRAAALGVAGTVSVRGVQGGDAIVVRLTSAEPMPPEASLAVRLVHPGRSGVDRSAVLARHSVGEDGRSAEFVGQWNDALPVTSEVPWRLVMEARDWRIEEDASALTRRGSLQISAQR